MIEIGAVLSHPFAVIRCEDDQRVLEQTQRLGRLQNFTDEAIGEKDIGVVLGDIEAQTLLVFDLGRGRDRFRYHLVVDVEIVAQKGILDSRRQNIGRVRIRIM